MISYAYLENDPLPTPVQTMISIKNTENECIFILYMFIGGVLLLSLFERR